MKIKSISKQILADLTTPVALFLKLRDHFSEILLLESSDYSSKEDSLSFICIDSLSSIRLEKDQLWIDDKISESTNIVNDLGAFIDKFDISGNEESKKFNGIFGFSSYDLIEKFETIRFKTDHSHNSIPSMRYDFYRYLFVFDHFYNQLYLVENIPEGSSSKIQEVLQFVYILDYSSFPFSVSKEEKSNMSDAEFLGMVQKAKEHCQRGDVFQIVLSRQYQQEFQGDEFNVYRHLRSVNPSPYLYYFDYGSYKIFGSSPEAQIKVEGNLAEIHPIAGTFLRTGDFAEDQEAAERLTADPKESAEHVMLVDLARNDLSKHSSNVKVEYFKQVQYFSHVIHLVSKVTGNLTDPNMSLQVYADTFPAGTLSGAPKYKAMELIDKYEPHRRSFYGGAIGMFKMNGDVNHAIIIRSFLSRTNTLFYQAGAGIVIGSDPQSELQEVKNKLAALKTAIVNAKNSHNE
jgi:anthranilate synthase component 1